MADTGRELSSKFRDNKHRNLQYELSYTGGNGFRLHPMHAITLD